MMGPVKPVELTYPVAPNIIKLKSEVTSIALMLKSAVTPSPMYRGNCCLLRHVSVDDFIL